MNSAPTSVPDLRRILRAILGVSLRLFALYVVVQVLCAVLLVFNARRGDSPMPADVRALASSKGGFDHVVFHAADGIQLRGEFLGRLPYGPAVIFGHGYHCRRRQGDPLAMEFLSRGYAVLLFDFRGCGASDGAFTTAGGLEDRDVVGAVRFLEGRGVARRKIAYIGFSMGAVAALEAAPQLKGLAAVALVAPFARMVDTFDARTRHFSGMPLTPIFVPSLALYRLFTGVDPTTVNPIERVVDFRDVPLLILGGGDDWRAPFSDLVAMKSLRPDATDLVVIDNADHYALAAFPPEVRTPIVDFITKNLAPGKPPAERR